MSPGTGYIDMMIDLEGEVHHPYLDQASVATIGIGSTKYENGNHVTMSDPSIGHQRSVDLLLFATMSNQRLLNHYFPDGTINQNQNDSLLEFMYNIGSAGFQTSSVLRLALKDPNDPGIRKAFLLWDKIHQDGHLVFSEALYERRVKTGNNYFS